MLFYLTMGVIWILSFEILPEFSHQILADERIRVATGGDVLVVPIHVAGRERMFLFDTGCGRTMFDPMLAKTLGARTRSIQSFDGFDFRAIDLFVAPPTRLGNLSVTPDEVVLQDLRIVRAACGYQISGVIGVNVLERYAVSIDFEQGELRVHDTPLNEELKQGFRKRCVLRHDPSSLVVFNKLPGNVVDDLEPFLIDTGKSVSLGLKVELFDALVQSGAMQNLRRLKSSSSTITREITNGDLHGFEFAGVKHSSLRCTRMKVNVIGQALLSRFQMTMDFQNQVIWFRPGKRIGDPDPTDLLGIGTKREETGAVVVGDVRSDTVAEKAGMAIGDEILEIDGRTIKEFTLFQMRLRFTQPGKCRLKFRRNETINERQFHLTPMKPAGELRPGTKYENR